MERDKTIELAHREWEARFEKREEVERKREEGLLMVIEKLIFDPDFVTISTQAGMRAYALEKFPGLEDVDPRLLTQKIRRVKDQIKSRGLHRKRR